MLNIKSSSSVIYFTPEMAGESTVWSMDQKYAHNLVSGSDGTKSKHRLGHTFTSI